MNLDDLAQAVRNRDARTIHKLLFVQTPVPWSAKEREMLPIVDPVVDYGGRSETELWDYKADVPRTPQGWATVARHALAFHNNRGGVLIFGIRDGDYSYVGATDRVDSKVVNDKIRRYLGDGIWIDFHRVVITSEQRYLGFAIVPPRGGQLGYFRADAPLAGGKREFLKNESALRTGDSSLILSNADALAHQASFSPSLTTNLYAVDQPFFRVFALETEHFVKRPALHKALTEALADPRTSVTSLVGVGGSGKTTLATWATMQAFDQSQFGFIVSVTAKDRELATEGIRSLSPALTSYDTMLATILDVLGFPDIKREPRERQEAEVRSLLAGSNGLLYVDNLETVDDPRVIQFLDDLPVGVKALVTSRRTRVRVSVRPIDVGPLSSEEAEQLVRSLADVPGLGYVTAFTKAELERITEACDRLPLAIRWTLLRADGASEAVQRAERLRTVSRQESELLEFTFRRVFEEMSAAEKGVMRTLGIFQEPSSLEALVAGTGSQGYAVIDALEDLVSDAMVQRMFDSDRNDYTYQLAPLTRSFVLTEMRDAREAGAAIRKRLAEWYEARDVANPDDRVVVRELRQGSESPEAGLLDLATAAQRRGDNWTAEEMYEKALERNPTSWRAARLFAEFQRHKGGDTVKALDLYERAARHAPARGSDRALIFREWGMLLKESGKPNATDLAIEKFEVALKETPNDAMVKHALASMYDRKGVYRRVIELLEPLRRHPSARTQMLALSLLIRAYERTGGMLEAAECRAELREIRA